jgi:hypothetical protein
MLPTLTCYVFASMLTCWQCLQRRVPHQTPIKNNKNKALKMAHEPISYAIMFVMKAFELKLKRDQQQANTAIKQ